MRRLIDKLRAIEALFKKAAALSHGQTGDGELPSRAGLAQTNEASAVANTDGGDQEQYASAFMAVARLPRARTAMGFKTSR
jgi:hypothetical protein